MRHLLFIIFSLFFTVQTQTQTTSEARSSKQAFTKYREDFEINVKVRFGNVEFERSPALDNSLKEKIETFFKSPPSVYSGGGSFSLRIVLYNDYYYIVEGSGFDERLHPLSKE